MKSDVEKLDATKVKISVEVGYDELRPSIEKAYKEIANQISVPGFRKGKVPAAIIDQRVGRPAVIEQAVNDSLGEFYSQAVSEANLRPLAQPNVEVTAVPGLEKKDEGTLAFTAEVEVRPEIELPELSGLTLEVANAEVSAEDIDSRLDSLRERFGTLVGVDRPAADGDFVVIDLNAKIDDQEIDSVSGISYQIGSGSMLEGLDEALVGLSADETTTFEGPLAGGDNEGKDAFITVTAKTVKERELPAIDDDFAQLASEFDTIEELKEDLAKQAADAKVQEQAVAARDELLKVLTAGDIPLPAGVIEAEVVRHLEGEGKALDDEHRVEVEAETKTALTNQIVLDTLAEKLEVKVSQQELLDYLLNSARQYGVDPNKFIQDLDQSGQIPAVVAEVARSKSIAVALRKVEVKDAAGNVVDLSDFIGSDEEVEDSAEEAAQVAEVTEN